MAIYTKTGENGFLIESHNGVYTAIVGAESRTFDNLFEAVEWAEAMRQLEVGVSDG